MRYVLAATLLTLAVVTRLASAAAESIKLPDMGDTTGALISPFDEQRLGEAFMRAIRKALLFVEDPVIDEYVKGLGGRLAANSDNQYQQFTFFVIGDDTINAFAAPGGFIGIHTGLILATESESELASVLAHEIAHVTQRHLARAYEQQKNLSLPTLAAIVAAVIVGTQNSEMGQAAMAMAQAGSAQAQLNFTRHNEEEADRLGIQTLSRSGYDPRGMPAFFERMGKASRYSSQPPEFLSTHPVTVSRIADSRNRAEQYPYRQVADSLDYHLVRARIRVLLSDDPRTAVNYFKGALAKGQYRNEDAARYGYALALKADRRPEEAREQINMLLKENPERLAYHLALANIELASGNTAAANTIYEKALQVHPHNHPLTVDYANALLAQGRAEEARLLLDKHIRYRGPDPKLYQLLAVAEGKAGHRVAAHVAMAESYYLNGQTHAAIDQLRIARELQPTDFYEASKIDARLRQLEAEVTLAQAR